MAVVLLCCGALAHGRQAAEKLDRGLVAIPAKEGGALVSWRLLASDAENTGFHLYRERDGEASRVNKEPLVTGTCLVDPTPGDHYWVCPVVEGEEGERSRKVPVLEHPWLDIPIQPIERYRPGDCSVADLDGDGDYELVVHQTGRARDNSHAGLTSAPILDAYELDGTLRWRINLGTNIREGEHYTQFIVYDLDGDGCAEVVCKTADGSMDGTGTVIGDAEKDWRVLDEDSKSYGRILQGPEFLTIFDGKTGKALETVDFVPGRDPIDGWGGIGGNAGNDRYGNRCDRFLACVAYLDGERPSVVMTRGVYGRIVAAAWDWRDGKLTSRWVFDSGVGRPPYREVSPFSGMGGHSLAVTDVDADGRDEIVFQAMTIDDNGKGLFSTGRRHGDSLQVGDIDPSRPGLELYLVSENEDETVRWQTPGAGLHDARTGEVLWSHSPGVDISTGMAADIDPRHYGEEIWGGPGGLRTAQGKEIGAKPRFADWTIWWDGDLQREIYGGYRIFKWNWKDEREEEIFRAAGPSGEGRSRFRFMRRWPNLTADLIGDWREELLLTVDEGKALRLYLTQEPSDHRVPCLMQDPQYRLSVVLQNVAYNKPPHVGFYLGTPAPGR